MRPPLAKCFQSGFSVCHIRLRVVLTKQAVILEASLETIFGGGSWEMLDLSASDLALTSSTWFNLNYNKHNNSN